jgi:hypothetical protein
MRASSDPYKRRSSFLGQSILYSMIAALFCFDGTPLRDFLLRVPSLIGMGLAAYFINRLGEGWIGRGAGLAGVILFVFHPDLTMIGYQARPYALAIAAVTGSCWALCEWDRTRERRPLLWYLCIDPGLLSALFLRADSGDSSALCDLCRSGKWAKGTFVGANRCGVCDPGLVAAAGAASSGADARTRYDAIPCAARSTI